MLYRYIVTVETDGSETDRDKTHHLIGTMLECSTADVEGSTISGEENARVTSIIVDPVALTDTIAIVGPK